MDNMERFFVIMIIFLLIFFFLKYERILKQTLNHFICMPNYQKEIGNKKIENKFQNIEIKEVN